MMIVAHLIRKSHLLLCLKFITIFKRDFGLGPIMGQWIQNLHYNSNFLKTNFIFILSHLFSWFVLFRFFDCLFKLIIFTWVPCAFPVLSFTLFFMPLLDLPVTNFLGKQFSSLSYHSSYVWILSSTLPSVRPQFLMTGVVLFLQFNLLVFGKEAGTI